MGKGRRQKPISLFGRGGVTQIEDQLFGEGRDAFLAKLAESDEGVGADEGPLIFLGGCHAVRGVGVGLSGAFDVAPR